jgi:hypothetical protein
MEISAPMKIIKDDEKTILSKESAMVLTIQLICQDINTLNLKIINVNRFLYICVLY